MSSYHSWGTWLWPHILWMRFRLSSCPIPWECYSQVSAPWWHRDHHLWANAFSLKSFGDRRCFKTSCRSGLPHSGRWFCRLGSQYWALQEYSYLNSEHWGYQWCHRGQFCCFRDRGIVTYHVWIKVQLPSLHRLFWSYCDSSSNIGGWCILSRLRQGTMHLHSWCGCLEGSDREVLDSLRSDQRVLELLRQLFRWNASRYPQCR